MIRPIIKAIRIIIAVTEMLHMVSSLYACVFVSRTLFADQSGFIFSLKPLAVSSLF
jgi:hypothetical protein